MVPTYTFLVIIFSAAYALLFFFKLRNTTFSGGFRTPQRFEMLFFGATLVLLVLPRIVYAVLNPQSFNSPDIFAYMHDSEQILTQGHVPEPSVMWSAPYYASFPVVTLLISSLTSISGLNTIQSIHVLNIVIQVLFWASIWIFLNRHYGKITTLRYLFFGMVIAAYANPYLYGYFNTLLPQTVGLPIILLLCLTWTGQGKSYSLTYVMLVAIGLVHVVVIPTFLLILIVMLLTNHLSKILSTRQLSTSMSVPKRPYSLVISAVVFTSYIIYTVALVPVVNYLQKIFLFFSALQEEALRGQLTISESLPRGVFGPLNAMGPSLVIGATVGFILLHLRSMHRREKSHNWLGAVAATALILIFLGMLRQRFDVWGNAFFSISRYFALPGYALAAVVASWAIANSFAHDERKRSSILLLIVLLLSALGGFLDPLAF